MPRVKYLGDDCVTWGVHVHVPKVACGMGQKKNRGLVGAKDPQSLSSLGPTNLKDDLSRPIFAYFLTSVPAFLSPVNSVFLPSLK